METSRKPLSPLGVSFAQKHQMASNKDLVGSLTSRDLKQQIESARQRLTPRKIPAETFYESTMSKFLPKHSQVKLDGPLASTIEGIRQSIDGKAAVDTQSIAKDVRRFSQSLNRFSWKTSAST
jgi:hypothetical protein